jgi:plastocyanin
MRSLPPLGAIVLLGAIAWTASLVGRDPETVDGGRASAQQVGFTAPRTPMPWPVRQDVTQPAVPAAKIVAVKIVAVKIDNFAFEPASLTVAKGTTVEWTNGDDVPHTVVEKKTRFKSKALDTDDRYRHTFNEPGNFSYFCSIHPHMVGEIHVTP